MRGFQDYPNVTRAIGLVISSGKASLCDLDERLGVEDLFDLVEIIQVDAYNTDLAQKQAAREHQ